MDKKRLITRVKEHRNESIEKVNEFTSIKIESKNATLFYENNTKSPKGDEEKIKKILLNNKKDKITMFQNDNSKNDYREYFICNDIDYITQSIIPLIKNLKDI
jgi:predicted ATP-grasp superfamily ATP-dependent carboligase